MKFIKLIVFIASISYLGNILAAGASNEPRLNKINFCKVTQGAENDYEPENFETTNNLLRETGQESLYCGEKIIISGVVVDESCVPVADAKVYIWQVDCKGKYPYVPLKTNLDNKLIHSDKLLTFTGNGSATTNNKGQFHFITVYPPGAQGLPSHVNIRVEHRNLGALQTRLILKGHKLANPEFYPELNYINQVAAKSNISIYNYQLVMRGRGEDKY